MKLYIEISFFDAIMDLPRGAQKRARDFLKKFQANPKSPGIHLEKIAQWKQPELRSARVDQGYRAVVYQSPREEVFRLLWVGNHDAAYAWPMGKQFSWNEQVQSFQVFEVQTDLERPPSSEPAPGEAEIVQKDLFIQLADQQLLQLGVPPQALTRVRQITKPENIWQLEKSLPQDAFEYLFYYVEGTPYEELLAEIQAGLSPDAGSSEAVDSPNAMRFSRLVVDDADLEQILSEGLEKWQVFLHPSQYQLAYRSFPGSVKVTGAAGTGKTVAALHRAKYLSGRPDFEDARPILFTTYTKLLTAALKEQALSLGINLQRVHIENIHKLAHEWASRFELIPEGTHFLDFTEREKEQELWAEVLDFHATDFTAEQLRDEYHAIVLNQDLQTEAEYLGASRLGQTFRVSFKQRKELWRSFETFRRLRDKYRFAHFGDVFNQVARYLQARPDLRPYRHIVCDELQDLSNLELRFLRSLAPEGPDDLFLVGDPLQKIYARKLSFAAAGINVRGRRSRRLKLNYRTTEEIKRAAISTIQAIPLADFEETEAPKDGYLSLMHGEQPVYQVYPSREAEWAAVLALLHQLERAGVLAWSDIVLAAPRRDQLKALAQLLHTERLPSYNLVEKNGQPDGIRLSTFHTLKGLEFRCVVLTHVDAQSVPSRPHGYDTWSKAEQHYHDQRERSLLYVAMSRAIERLFLTGTGERSAVIGF